VADEKMKYTVGYRKPPKETQFKKGVSGNPRGRPKGSRNLNSVILDVATRPICITEGAEKRTGIYTEAMVLDMAQKAIKGDRHARSEFLNLLIMAEKSEEDDGSSQELDELDAATLRGAIKRLQSIDTNSLFDPEMPEADTDAIEVDAEATQTSDDLDSEPPTPEED
jgi:hypothetical protein